MPIESRKIERIVGFFIIALVVITTTLVFMLLRQRDWFAKKFEVRSVFERGAAISEGTAVMMEGIQIGRVKKLRFNMQNQLEGVLSLNVHYRRQVRKDSVATIVRTHLLANPQIDISVGSPNEPLLGEGETIPAVATVEPTMQDFLSVANNVVVVVRDLRDPKGPFQRILRNMDDISSKLAQGSGSVPTMLKDDGGLFRDSRDLLGDLSGMLKGKDSVPITMSPRSELTLTPESQLIVSLSDKLDKQTDIFTELAIKIEKIVDRLLAKDNMAGALLSDPEFYSETRQFLRESRSLLIDLSQLAEDLRGVVPELPGLISEGKADLKEMGKVLRGLQKLPFVGVAEEPAPKPETLHVPGRLNPLEEKR